jgi:hypothetical protein
MKKSILIAIAIVVVALLAIGGFLTYLHPSAPVGASGVCQTLGSGPAPGFASSISSSSTATFVIIESDAGSYEGINGSAHHQDVPWPVVVVHRGQTVVFDIYNCGSSEPHGFAVSHFFPAGISVLPTGQIRTVNFVANQVGNFTIFCSILCAIHPLMQNGRLVVEP